MLLLCFVGVVGGWIGHNDSGVLGGWLAGGFSLPHGVFWEGGGCVVFLITEGVYPSFDLHVDWVFNKLQVETKKAAF